MCQAIGVEDERGVCATCAHALLLCGAFVDALLRGFRVAAHAPAAAEDATVPLDQLGKGVPRRRVEGRTVYGELVVISVILNSLLP